MNHSNTSLQTYLSCQKKFKYTKLDNVKPELDKSAHLTFGAMAHEVLEKAGNLRDNVEAGIEDYDECIPNECLHGDLKEFFGIKSWQKYFINVCKSVAEIEKKLLNRMKGESDIEILRELEVTIPSGQGDNPIKGLIDLCIISKNKAIICDYKFSSSSHNQDHFDFDSQLYMYAFFIQQKYKIPLRNIVIAYIDICKKDFCEPVMLANGTLSRAKSQRVLYEEYVKAIDVLIALKRAKPEDKEPGGYYWDAMQEFKSSKVAYLVDRWVDEKTFKRVMKDVMTEIVEIDMKEKIYREQKKDLFLRKMDSYSCSGCEYRQHCMEED